MKPAWLQSLIPPFFCAFLSGMMLVDSTATPAFYSFLPMCFFFVGAQVHFLNKEIVSLRKRLDEIEPQTSRGVRPGGQQASDPPR